MEITVITATGVVAWVAGASRVGEIYASNAKDMVTKVLQEAGEVPIDRLNLLDHSRMTSSKLKEGTSRSVGIKIGGDVINEHNIGKFGSLRLLKGRFAPGGLIHLQHCDIGLNQDLMKKLAAMCGATVYGGTGAHNPLLRVNYGKYVRCEATGVCQTDVDRP